MDFRVRCRDTALQALLLHLRRNLSVRARPGTQPIVISDVAADCTPSTILVVDPRKPGAARALSSAIREECLGGAIAIDRLELDLPAAVCAVSAGLLAFSPGLFADLARVNPLSRRQQQILQLVALGLSNPIVAQRLRISRSTVKREISSLIAAFSCANRSQLVAAAAEQGFLRSLRSTVKH